MHAGIAIAIAIALEIYLKKFKYSVFIFFDKAVSTLGVSVVVGAGVEGCGRVCGGDV